MRLVVICTLVFLLAACTSSSQESPTSIQFPQRVEISDEARAVYESAQHLPEWEALTLQQRRDRFPLLWNEIFPSDWTLEHQESFNLLEAGALIGTCETLGHFIEHLKQTYGLTYYDGQYIARIYLDTVRLDQPDWILRWLTCELDGAFGEPQISPVG